MFYVSGSKIYLATFDAELGVYPEVKLTRLDHDHIGVVKAGSGTAVRPVRCQVCSLAEIIAQFGGTVPPMAEVEDDDGDSDKT